MSQMPRFALGITALFFALSVSPAALAQTPEQYGSLPDVDDVEISPDGETLAIIKSFGSTGAVLFYDLDNMGAQPVGVGLGESKPRTIEWADNENLLLLASQAERKRTTDGIETIEFFRWLSISPEEGKANLLFGNAAGYYQSSAGTLLSTLPSKPGKAVFQRSSITYRTDGRASRFDNDDEFKLSLFEVDLARGREKNIESGNEETVDWVIDAEGAPVARIDYDWSAAERKVYIADGRSWVLNSSLPEERSDLAVASFYGMGSRPQTMLATTYGARDKRSLVEYDIATGSFTNTLFANPTYDIDYVVYNPSLATADAVVYTDDLPRAKYLDPELQSVQDSLVKALPGAAPMIVSRTDDDMKMIVKAIYTDHPPQYFLFDRNAKKLNMIAPTYPALDGKVQEDSNPVDRSIVRIWRVGRAGRSALGARCAKCAAKAGDADARGTTGSRLRRRRGRRRQYDRHPATTISSRKAAVTDALGAVLLLTGGISDLRALLRPHVVRSSPHRGLVKGPGLARRPIGAARALCGFGIARAGRRRLG